MGADMMVAIAAAPQLAKGAGKVIDRHRVNFEGDSFTFERIVWLASGLVRVANMRIDAEDFKYLAMYQDGEPTELEIRLAGQNAVRSYMEYAGREIALVTLRKRHYVVTGGVTSGDVATDAFDWVDQLERLHVWDEKISAQEARAVLLFGLAECGTCHLVFLDIHPSARCPFEGADHHEDER